MITATGVGSLTLNTSFILYLIVYIPQIIHNHKSQHLAQLSIGLHLLLYLSYSFDLFYGFAMHLPWQYKTVSITGLSLLTLQHFQLLGYFMRQRFVKLACAAVVFFLLNIFCMLYFFIIAEGVFNTISTMLFGTISRSCGLLYCLPQIIKNKRLQSAKGISVYFALLNLLVSLLDTVSAWCLDWGWPNKVAAPLSCCIMLIVLKQAKKYTPSPFNPSMLQGAST